jgi:hypothetical protein
MLNDPALVAGAAVSALILFAIIRAIVRAWRLGDVQEMGVSQNWLAEHKARELP